MLVLAWVFVAMAAGSSIPACPPTSEPIMPVAPLPVQPKYILVKPQDYINIITDDIFGGGEQSYLLNTLSSEVVALPGHGWEAEVDKGSGMCIMYDADGDGTWASDRLALHVYEDPVVRSRKALYTGDSLVGEYADLRARHDIMETSLVRKPFGEKVLVQVAAFHFEQPGGCRLWVSVSDLWAKMNWQFSPKTGAQWYQDRLKRWAKIAEVLELGELAARSGLTYKATGNGAEDSARCLCFSSISLPLLLVQCACGVHGSSRQEGKIDDDFGRAGFAAILGTLLSFVKADHTFELRLGGFVRAGSRGIGRYPARLKVAADRKISFEGCGPGALPCQVHATLRASKLLELEGKLLDEAFSLLMIQGVKAGRGTFLAGVASQLLWQVSKLAEDKLGKAAVSKNLDGTRRVLRAMASDISVDGCSAPKVYDPNNWRHTSRELHRYREACRREFGTPQFVSMAGPDGTKVGTDLSIQIGVLLNPVIGVAAVAPPQVQKQYLSHAELGGPEAAKAARESWARQALFMAKRKKGIDTGNEKAEPCRKRRRVKTLQTILSVNNMLEQCCGVGLDHFVPKKGANGKLPSPFDWPHANLATDQGSDNICMDHFWGYQLQANVHTDWDTTHGAHNDTCKDALKQCGLWRHTLSMMSAMNAAYGSTMSPPRLQQIRDATVEYMQTADPTTDPWFQFWLPHIIKQQGGDLQLCSEGAATQVWQLVKDSAFHPPLRQTRQRPELQVLDLKSVCGYGNATWYTPQAQSCMRPVADMIAARQANNQELGFLDRCWLCRVVSKRMLIRRAGTEDWFFALGDICGTLVVAWPAKVGPQENSFELDLQDGRTSSLFAVLDLDLWEARPYEIHSPLHQAVVLAGGIDETTEVNVPASGFLKIGGMLPMATGPAENLKVVAARQAFGTLPMDYLSQLLLYFGLEEQSTLVEHIARLARHLIPELSDAGLIAILEKRKLAYEEDPDIREVLDDEAIIESFDAKEKANLLKELESCDSAKAVKKTFHQELKDFKTRTIGAKKLKTDAKDLHKMLLKRKGKLSVSDWKTSRDDLPQSEARRYLPVNANIWRANQIGAWSVHVQGHKRHSEVWSKHGDSSRDAMKAAVRYAWQQYLDDNSLDTSSCPIEGLFA